MKKINAYIFKVAIFFGGIICPILAYADSATTPPNTVNNLGDMAAYITKSFQSFGQFLTAGAYLAGFILVISAIFKFKQHKDNPTQIPMGAPFALLAIGVALIFFPSLIAPAGKTLIDDPTYGGFYGEGITNIDLT